MKIFTIDYQKVHNLKPLFPINYEKTMKGLCCYSHISQLVTKLLFAFGSVRFVATIYFSSSILLLLRLFSKTVSSRSRWGFRGSIGSLGLSNLLDPDPDLDPGGRRIRIHEIRIRI